MPPSAATNKQPVPAPVAAPVPAPAPTPQPSMVILNPQDLLELSGYLCANITDKDSLVNQCRKMASVNVEGQQITLESGLLQRLKSRCPSNMQFGPWLKARIIEMCHGYVGW